jgi:hypothetical protein
MRLCEPEVKSTRGYHFDSEDAKVYDNLAKTNSANFPSGLGDYVVLQTGGIGPKQEEGRLGLTSSLPSAHNVITLLNS